VQSHKTPEGIGDILTPGLGHSWSTSPLHRRFIPTGRHEVRSLQGLFRAAHTEIGHHRADLSEQELITLSLVLEACAQSIELSGSECVELF
jgi:hypothetical protein